MNNAAIQIDGKSLTLAQFHSVVWDRVSCDLSPAARRRVQAGRRVVDDNLAGGRAVYGVNTGFGDLARVRIDDQKLRTLQERLILSHCSGLGEPLDDAVVRGMLLLRANTLARGHSGVRAEVIEALLKLLNSDVLPVVPSRGSVGASGDLAPLAHLAIVLIGGGKVRVNGKALSATDGLKRAGFSPLKLEAKEGLALINGTQAMTSLLSLAVLAAQHLTRVADAVSAMSTDALRGTDAAFDPRLHQLRPYAGQLASAKNLWNLLQGSGIRESHRENDLRIQDPYSIRCIPQVHGAVRDIVADVERKVSVELNAVTDNPLVFEDSGDIISGGNFHGEPMALAADILALALAELGGISERRIEKLTNTEFSGLPPFLVKDAGLNSGFMIAQITAAALVNESKTLCHPASVDSISTSADKEDHVSMGMWASLKLHQVLENTSRILGIELVAAAQGIDLLRPLKSSNRIEVLHRMVRAHISPWHQDREMAPDLETGRGLIDELKPYVRALE